MKKTNVVRVIALFSAMLLLPFFAATAETTPVVPLDASDLQQLAAPNDQPALPADAFPPDQFMTGRIIKVLEKGTVGEGEFAEDYQLSRVQIISGPEKDKEVDIKHAGIYNNVGVGDKVVVTKVTVEGDEKYYIADEYRLSTLVVIGLLFFGLAALWGRRQGVMSILGLAFSIFVLTAFVVPRILAGSDPLIITLLGATMIMVVSLFLSHGFNGRTVLAFGSTAVTLGIAATLAGIFVNAAKLMGLGSDEAAYLQLGAIGITSLKGLLLGGIIIGTLGVLDDVTTAQTATIDEISRANPALGPSELYKSGLSVGREHIASLVNTLALAYAGASLPLFLLFSFNHTQPLWVLLNSETIAEEIVRTLVGSCALVLAVPISTLVASWAFGSERGRAYFKRHNADASALHSHRH